MSKATILASLKDGLYRASLDFNTEVIQFNIERYRLRLADIDNVDGPAADEALALAEEAFDQAKHDLDELIKKLGGQPSAELITLLAAIESDLTNASDALDQVNTGLLGAATSVSNSQAALPAGAPPEILNAYAIANAALTLAFSTLNDEQNDLTPAQAHLNDVQDAIALDPPDLTAAQNALGLLREDLVTVSTDHVIASGRINEAHSEIQAVRNLLPADASYAAARAHLDAALAEFTDISSNHALAAGYEHDAATKADTAQDLLTPGNEAVNKRVQEALKVLNEASAARRAAQFVRDSLDLEYTDLQQKIGQLSSIPTSEHRELWCADLTEDIPDATAVGTMEVPGELVPYKETVIRPAFSPEHTHLWNQARDGWLTPTDALTPAAYFYNRAMLPGWQVFRPTFRFAVCTAINPDGTMNVGLIFPNSSSQQSIDVTPKSIPEGSFAEPPPVSFEHVPVKYMDCDIEAFALGDIVVVQFDNQKAENPRVIGFRDHPKPCSRITIDLLAVDISGFLFPVVGYLTAKKEADPWTFTGLDHIAVGSIDWHSDKAALSWDGWTNRYFDFNIDDSRRSRFIYHHHDYLAAVAANEVVLGAAKTIFNNRRYLITVVVSQDPLYYRALAMPWTGAYAESWPLSADIDVSSLPGDVRYSGTPFNFNADGDRAVALIGSGDFTIANFPPAYPVEEAGHSYSTLCEFQFEIVTLPDDTATLIVTMIPHGQKSSTFYHFDDSHLVGADIVGTVINSGSGELYVAADFQQGAIVAAYHSFDDSSHFHYTDAEQYEVTAHNADTMHIPGLDPISLTATGSATYTGHTYTDDASIDGHAEYDFVDFLYLDLRAPMPKFLRMHRTFTLDMTGGLGPWTGNRTLEFVDSHGTVLQTLDEDRAFGNPYNGVAGAGTTLLEPGVALGSWESAGYRIAATMDQFERFIYSVYIPIFVDGFTDFISLTFQETPKFANFIDNGFLNELLGTDEETPIQYIACG